MMLGAMRLEGTMYREREPTLAGELSPERLEQAVSIAAADHLRSAQRRGRATAPARRLRAAIWLKRTAPDVKDGAYAIRDGLLAIRRGPVFETAKVPGSVAWRIRGMLAVRDAIRLVFRTQLDDAPEERIAEARLLLNDIYDSFVSALRAAVIARERQGLCRRSRPAALTLP